MKQLLAAACLAIALPAFAEHGTQLPEWSASSPNQTPSAEPAATPAATATPAPAAEVKKEEKKDDKGPQTITAVATPEQVAAVTGLTVAASLDHYLGQGTFIDAQKYASLAAAIDLSARYSFKLGGIKLGVSGRGYVSYEYTLPDSANGRRWSWRDLSFAISAPAIYKDSFTGIAVSPSLSATVPITLESWQATTITVLGAGVNLTRSVWRFDFSFSGGASRGFHVDPVVAARAGTRTDPAGNRIELARFGESVASVIGTNTAWSVRGTIAATFHVTEELTFDASYTLSAGWKYPLGPNNYASQATFGDGSHVCPTDEYCRGGDLMISSVSANYQISDHWGAALYIYTGMPPRTADGKNFRFPFWAFDGAANNYSSLGLSLQANF